MFLCEVVRNKPILAVAAGILFTLGLIGLTSGTRLFVSPQSLTRVNLPAGDFDLERASHRIPSPLREGLTIETELVDTPLTYYSHEPEYLTLLEIDTDKPITVWFEHRETHLLFLSFGTIHAVQQDDWFAVDFVGILLHRRRIAARAAATGLVTLLILVPALLWLASERISEETGAHRIRKPR